MKLPNPRYFAITGEEKKMDWRWKRTPAWLCVFIDTRMEWGLSTLL
jgi:hypothetical protein